MKKEEKRRYVSVVVLFLLFVLLPLLIMLLGPKKYTEEGLKQVVIGSTRDEVREKLGVPLDIIWRIKTEGREYWTYSRKSVIKGSRLNTPTVQVIFENGIAIEVRL